jgi:hypothetical protein
MIVVRYAEARDRRKWPSFQADSSVTHRGVPMAEIRRRLDAEEAIVVPTRARFSYSSSLIYMYVDKKQILDYNSLPTIHQLLTLHTIQIKYKFQCVLPKGHLYELTDKFDTHASSSLLLLLALYIYLI